MLIHDVSSRLREHGINPSAQRVAVGAYVLATGDHPTADEVWKRVRERFPIVSRATVYNTLNLFVERGLLRTFTATGGCVVFDPNLKSHHHFIDEETGAISDIPWHALEVPSLAALEGIDVTEYQVVVKGRRAPRPNASHRGRPRAGSTPRRT
jgi:Fur family iron response transcriptional regulator